MNATTSKHTVRPPTLPSDDALLEAIASGDGQAYLDLYERYADRLFVFCMRMMRDREVAKDALQNALMRIYENAGQYRTGSNASAWIFRLTRNVCIDMLRSMKQHEQYDEESDVLSRDPRTPDVALQEALTQEIEALPKIYREAVVLRDVQGHSYKEIAEIVEAPLSTVKFRIFKARDILRDRLRKYLDQDET